MSYVPLRYAKRIAMLQHQIRFESTMTNLTHDDYLYRPKITNWGRIIREAEKIVGYPTSFMNLRWLLNDEFANIALHLRKIVGSNHPILETAKSVLYNEHNNLQPWGLIILLLSKAIEPPSCAVKAQSLIENYRILAELTEMIRTGHYVHRGILNLNIEDRSKTNDTAIFANNIALLLGDYLLVTANGMLARLKNQDLSYLISSALRDMSAGEFFGDRDRQNLPLPGKPLSVSEDVYKIKSDTSPLNINNVLGSPVKEWTLRTMFNGGSLFGRGCQGVLVMSEKAPTHQENAYLFGCHICLAWQAASELRKFTVNDREPFSLVSAPVLFAISENPDLYRLIEMCSSNVKNVDLDRLRVEINKTDAMEKTKMLHLSHIEKAQIYLDNFGDSEAIEAIKELLLTK